jgi:RepB DNA-primase from phage plasmid/Recombinase
VELKEKGSRVSLAGRVYTKLGGPNPLEALRLANLARDIPAPAQHVIQLVCQKREAGSSLRSIAAELNSRDIRTPGGFHWYASTVSSVLSRFNEKTKERNDAIPQPRYDDITLASSSFLNDFGSPAIPSLLAPNAGRGTTKEGCKAMFDIAEAYRMLDTFASVGALHFDRTILDIDGQKRGFRAEQTIRQLRESLPQLVPGLESRRDSLIVRPHSDKVQLIQLDDLNYEQLKLLAAVSFLILETSPGNHQAWVAVSDGNSDAKDFARRLRKGCEADPTASGATRVAGTVNYKRKYEAAFPTVKILQAAPGRISSRAQLETFGLVAPLEAVAPSAPLRVFSDSGRKWPDYQRCVLGAPQNNAKSGPDISRADFFWSFLAAQRGFSIDEIANRLMDVSSKAEENGEQYARLTAENAAIATERQRRNRS